MLFEKDVSETIGFTYGEELSYDVRTVGMLGPLMI